MSFVRLLHFKQSFILPETKSRHVTRAFFERLLMSPALLLEIHRTALRTSYAAMHCSVAMVALSLFVPAPDDVVQGLRRSSFVLC